LPFGLSPAPFIFTKTMRVLIKFWRENMIKIAIFIDDGFGTKSVYEKAKQDAIFVKRSLELSGFVVNIQKSVWNPQQKLTWLGISVDLTKIELYIPEKRMSSTKPLITDIISRLPVQQQEKF
ncbi:reverse transcriptase domain-containing protein, partial [Acinetobacter baumannii]|uniref:reverse transcriptase domain-containing protein n=1 Tax=Acinetobacter baumannii TaxID=470 RepID=UPI0011775FAE